MLGGAATAPLMPAPVLAKAASKGAVTYSPAAVHAAIYHAQSRAVFSVWGLASAANLTIEQATEVMEHLAERGILGPLQGTNHGGRWASSKILQSDMLAKARAAKAARRAAQATEQSIARFDVNLRPFIERVRTIAARYESQKPVLATT